MSTERIYLDTAPVIYAVERVAAYAPAVDSRLANQEVILIASDLTRMECRVGPLRQNDRQLLFDFDQFFEEACSEIIALSKNIIDKATEIRAEYGYKAPDAVRLAAAELSHCDVFLTNDEALKQYPNIEVETVSA